jgi:hypothetical protein
VLPEDPCLWHSSFGPLCNCAVYSCITQAGIRVSGVMGTSAGALAGSLWAAGYSPREVSAQVNPSQSFAVMVPCLCLQ